MLRGRVDTYLQEHNKNISTEAFSQMLSVTLYNRRFFPLYIWNVVTGMDANGKGLCYTYDPLGCVESVPYTAKGSSGAILLPFLDNQLGGKNLKDGPKKYSADDAVKLVRDVFISAAERDIHCGDSVTMKLVTKESTNTFTFPLRRD
ncbi:Proteasome subunit beta type-1 [Cichlidogyrus casuarinus]|uniref:Proteasome subunit beta type-1 n=1 Tax=Cichlidogyrus casuarinus TaxID=1844966 RepID=A0ABD2PZ24_9PLAT